MSKQTELAQVADTITVNSGNVGIGTSSPATSLHLGGSSDQSFEIDGSLTPMFMGTSGNLGQISVNRRSHDGAFADPTKSAAYLNLSSEVGGSTITFSTTTTNNANPTERMRINSSGNVGVNVSDPKAKLHIANNNTSTSTSKAAAMTLRTAEGDGMEYHLSHSTGYVGWVAATKVYAATGGSWGDGYLEFSTAGGSGNAVATQRLQNGYVTMPSQPYFAVEMNNTGQYIDTAPSTALPFNATIHNIGNHFNTSTYRFTAPITGKYLMTVGVINNQSNPIGRMMFYLNGNSDGGNMKWGINGSQTAGGGSHTATSIIYMSSGDYVDVRSQAGWINNYQDNHSSWTGMLLG